MTSPKLSLAIALASTLALAWASPAAAVLVDFRSSSFASADGASSYTSDLNGVTVTYIPLPDPEARLYWDETDGFGVRYDYETDEIEGHETLRIEFSEKVYLEKIHLTDLFYESGYLEAGCYELNDSGDVVDFVALESQGPDSNGERVLEVGVWTRSIDFRGIGQLSGQNHEFSVAGLDIRNPTPEPASLLVFAVGGTLVGAAIRRVRPGA
jgi:hypothetical protein